MKECRMLPPKVTTRTNRTQTKKARLQATPPRRKNMKGNPSPSLRNKDTSDGGKGQLLKCKESIILKGMKSKRTIENYITTGDRYKQVKKLTPQRRQTFRRKRLSSTRTCREGKSRWTAPSPTDSWPKAVLRGNVGKSPSSRAAREANKISLVEPTLQSSLSICCVRKSKKNDHHEFRQTVYNGRT